jgi:hypothetical protein
MLPGSRTRGRESRGSVTTRKFQGKLPGWLQGLAVPKRDRPCEVRGHPQVRQAAAEKVADDVPSGLPRAEWKAPLGKPLVVLADQFRIVWGADGPVVLEMKPPVTLERKTQRPETEETRQGVVDQPLSTDKAMGSVVTHDAKPVLPGTDHDDRAKECHPTKRMIPLQGKIGNSRGTEDHCPVTKDSKEPPSQPRLTQLAQRVKVHEDSRRKHRLVGGEPSGRVRPVGHSPPDPIGWVALRAYPGCRRMFSIAVSSFQFL